MEKGAPAAGIAALLHDCGKYISMVNLGECSYSIVMATEIIGLSHKEREIVANVVKYNHQEFDYYEELGTTTTLDPQAYLTIAQADGHHTWLMAWIKP